MLPPTLGPYRVGARLGSGGMSDVFKAIDERSGQVVALKVMRPLSAGRRASLDCFENEVAIMGALRHPNIAELIARGMDDSGMLYVAMPLVEGRSLRKLLNEARSLPEPLRARFVRRRLVPVFGQLCDAVSYAHGRGILHRDLKPANVLVDDTGHVTLLDWGVACPIAERRTRERLRREPPADERRARPRFGGTPGYMSPEQVHMHPYAQDERSDVWALGAILFELFAFRRLVPGQTAPELLERTLSGAFRSAPGSTLDQELAAALMPVVTAATMGDLDARTADVQALRDAVVDAIWPRTNLEVRAVTRPAAVA